MILNLEKPAVWQAITNEESSFWLRPSHEIRDEAAGQPRREAWPRTSRCRRWVGTAQNYTREHRVPPRQ